MAANSKNIYAPGSSSYPYTISVSFGESNPNPGNNTSVISITGSIYGKNIRYSSTSANTLAIYWNDDNQHGGRTLVNSIAVPSTQKGVTISVSGDITVTHKDDGSLNGYATVVFTKGVNNSYIPPTTTVSTSTVALTNIPRTTIAPNVGGIIGQSMTIQLSPSSLNFRHHITYTFGNTSGIIASNVPTTYNWVVPTSLYNQLAPTEKIKNGTLNVETYNNGVLIGSSSSILTLSVDENLSKPTISNISIVDTNTKSTALTGNKNVIVLNASNGEVSYTLNAQNGANISKVSINNLQVDSTLSKYTINTINSSSITIVVEDSRGLSNSATYIIPDSNLIKYIPLTIYSEFARQTPTNGKIIGKFKGNCFWGNFGKVGNSIITSYRFKENYSDNWSDWIILPINDIPTEETFANTGEILEGNFDYTKTYIFELKVSDDFNTDGIVTSHTISAGVPIYWWNGKSFNIEGILNLLGHNIVDLIYPIGSVFNSKENTNPSQLLGGTWEQTKSNLIIKSGTINVSYGGSCEYKIYGDGSVEIIGHINNHNVNPNDGYVYNIELPFSCSMNPVVSLSNGSDYWSNVSIRSLIYNSNILAIQEWNDASVLAKEISINFYGKGSVTLSDLNLEEVYAWKRIK